VNGKDVGSPTSKAGKLNPLMLLLLLLAHPRLLLLLPVQSRLLRLFLSQALNHLTIFPSNLRSTKNRRLHKFKCAAFCFYIGLALFDNIIFVQTCQI
jgi:hypothetical protein